MLLSALTLLTITTQIFAGPHDPAPASPGARPECMRILLETDFQVPNAQLFLKSVAEAPAKVTVELPYKMTTEYKVRLVKFDAVKLPAVRQVYLSHADQVQVIPAMAYLESWHNLIRHLDGFHFTLAFDTPAERNAFIEAVGYQVHVPAGRIKVGKATLHTVAVTPEQLTAAIHKFGKAKEAARAEGLYEPSTRAELETLSDRRSEATSGGGTRYFFKGQEAVGFVRGGKYFKYRKRPLATLSDATANFASHANILRRQRGGMRGQDAGATIPIDPQQQYREGRANLDADLATIENASTLPEAESARLKTQAEYRTAPLVVALGTVNYPWAGSLPTLLCSVATARLELFEAQLKHLPADTNFRIGDLGRVTNDVNALKAFKPDSTKFVRFIWLRKSTIHPSSFLRNSELVFVDGAVLHDQMTLLAYGKELGTRPDFIEEHLRGGMAAIRYDAEGKVSGVEIVDGRMGVPAGNFHMTGAETAKLAGELLAALQKPTL